MMLSISSYVRRGRHTLHELSLDPKVHTLIRYGLRFGAGFCLSAASLGNYAQPLCLGLVCAATGPGAALIALGSLCGYGFFWDSAGAQGMVWVLAGLITTLALAGKRVSREVPLLIPSIAALIVSATGVAFQFWLSDNTPIPIYLLRVALGASTARLFALVRERRDPIADWIACSLGVLALAQIRPFRFLGLGYIAAGALGVGGAFPAAALAGLALDLADITPIPMTGVLCLIWLTRLIPGGKRWMYCCAPGILCICAAWLCSAWDFTPLPGMILGGALGVLIPAQPKIAHRRGETGMAQVRLELTAGVFAQAEQLLLESDMPPLDETILVQKAAERACGSCANRKNCPDRELAAQMPPLILHRPLLSDKDLPVRCKKSGRLLGEVHRSQEQLRSLKASRERQLECREAVIQQYQFLSDYLMELSDRLAQRGNQPTPRYSPEVAVYANRRQEDNGDRCLWFAGTECRYYLLLCDGMGTGLGAVDEGKTAAGMLKKLLSAGFPAEYALRSLNSLCILRGRSGAVTVDLAEIHLDTGKATVYKWGAAPSYLLTASGGERIGTAGPPPGLSVADIRETTTQLSLRRGEWLMLLSDGAAGEEVLHLWMDAPDLPPGELAQRLLQRPAAEQTDDATIAMLRLGCAVSA